MRPHSSLISEASNKNLLTEALKLRKKKKKKRKEKLCVRLVIDRQVCVDKYHSETYARPCQTSMMEFFCENIKQILVPGS